MEGYARVRALYPDLPENLKDEQRHAIELLFQGKHVLVVLPTGFGKSLIYTIPPLIQEGKIALIISPLKALMASQVKSLRAKGVPCVAVMQDMTTDDRDRKYNIIFRLVL